MRVVPAAAQANHELISKQVSDLRSAVSKEACLSLGTIATALGDLFHNLAELWVPALLKQRLARNA